MKKRHHAWICWHLISCKKRKRRERNYHSLILLKKNVHFFRFSFFLCLSNEHSGGGSPCHGETSLGLDKRSEMKACQWLTRACSWTVFLGWSGGRWHCRWHCRWSGGRLGLNPGLRLPRIRNSRYTLVAQLDKAVMRLESVHSHFDFPGILLSISIFSPNHDWRADVFCSFDADYLDFLLKRHHCIHHQRNEEWIHESWCIVCSRLCGYDQKCILLTTLCWMWMLWRSIAISRTAWWTLRCMYLNRHHCQRKRKSVRSRFRSCQKEKWRKRQRKFPWDKNVSFSCDLRVIFSVFSTLVKMFNSLNGTTSSSIFIKMLPRQQSRLMISCRPDVIHEIIIFCFFRVLFFKSLSQKFMYFVLKVYFFKTSSISTMNCFDSKMFGLKTFL